MIDIKTMSKQKENNTDFLERKSDINAYYHELSKFYTIVTIIQTISV